MCVQDDVSFNSKLFVENDVSLNSKLFVENDVSFNSKLFVYDSFDVDGLVKLNNNTNSTNFDNGALIVTGGVGIGENLHVGENVTINSTDDSTLSTNGALIVKGGVGIAKNLNVGQNVTINSIDDSTSSGTGSLIVDGGVGIAKKLNVGQNVIINSIDDSASSATGSLIVKGGTGILKNLNVDGDVSLNSNVDISGNLNVLNKVHFKDSEDITNYNIAEQNFVVDGSVGITQKLIVGEKVAFNNTTSSSDINGCALTVNGGVGIGKNLNVGENLNVAQNVTINSITSSSNSNTGALTVGGGVGIGENLNVGGDVVIGNLLSTKDINAENILPKTDNTYNLGDSNNKWKQIFLDNSGINIGGSARIIKENNGTISMINTGGFEINGNLSITGQLTIPGENIQSSGQIISQSHIIGTPIGIDGTGNKDREQALFSSLDVLNESLFQNNITIYKDKKIKFANQQGTNHTDLIDAAFKTIDVSNNSTFKSDLNVNKNLNVGGTFTSNIESVLDDASIGPQNVFQPFVPPGAVMSFATKGAPQGWLPCNGQTLPITSYPNLSQVLGTTWGGDGINDFVIPNLNSDGHFIRGGSVDGLYNPDSTKKPTNNFNITASSSSLNGGTHSHHCVDYTQNSGHPNSNETILTCGQGLYVHSRAKNLGSAYRGEIAHPAGEHNHTINTTITTNINDTSTWDNETAPKNVILLYCIKY